MIAETTIRTLSISREDWRSLPKGYLRRRFGPLAIVALLCAGFSAVHIIDGVNQLRPEEVQKGIHALVLLLIPGVLAYVSYLDLAISLKILKATGIGRKDERERETDVR